jgi:hypothetical protein
MQKGLIASVAALLALAGLASAQFLSPTTQPIAPPCPTPTVIEPVECEPCCCPQSCWWFNAEYLLWWTKGDPNSTALVTTAPPGACLCMLGALGNPGTQVLIGGQSIDPEERSGGRFTLGHWFDPCQCCGVEASYFFLGNRSVSQSVSSGAAGSPVVAVPFFNTAFGFEDAYLVASPGVFAGSATLSVSSQLQGAECNGVCNLFRTGAFRVYGLGGFRYLNLVEDLTFATASRDLTDAGFINTLDEFDTRNNFYGGQLGLRSEFTRGRFVIETTAKVALGDMNEVVKINGSSFSNLTMASLGAPTIVAARSAPGGLFAQPSNIGNYQRNTFCVVPEGDITFGWQLTRRARVTAGYSFLYMSNVVRPGDQINRNLNLTQNVVQGSGTLVGPAQPSFAFHGTDYWAQGISFGLQLRF